MAEKKLSKSLRKYIRKEKSRIRREVLNIEKQKEMISNIYSQVIKAQNSTDKEKIKEKIKPSAINKKKNKIKNNK